MTEDAANATRSDPLVVLVDDVRIFRDGRPAMLAQTAAEAIALITSLTGQRIDQLWLDYDLFDATSEPLVAHLIELANAGRRADIAVILVHSSRVVESMQITQRLLAAGYPTRRSYAAGIWSRNPNTVSGTA